MPRWLRVRMNNRNKRCCLTPGSVVLVDVLPALHLSGREPSLRIPLVSRQNSSSQSRFQDSEYATRFLKVVDQAYEAISRRLSSSLAERFWVF